MTTDRDQGQKQSGPDRTTKALLWIFLTPFLLFAGCGGSEPSEGMARVMCEGFVEDRLKSPGSADFQRPTTTSAGVDTWTVAGSVDAQNSFGAMIRIDYECTVQGDGDGGWTLVNMEHNEL